MGSTTVRVNIKDFGGRADNIFDNTDAIQAAVNHVSAVMATGDSAVFFPEGTYFIGTGSISVPDNVTLEGAGAETIFRLGPDTADANLTAFTVADGLSAFFQDLRFQGPSTPGAFTIRAIDKLGTTGDLNLQNVTAINTASIRCSSGPRLIQNNNGDLIETCTAIRTLTHDGDAFWIGGTVPIILRGTGDPSVDGSTAPLSSIYLRQDTAGVFYKTTAADTGWTDLAGGGSDPLTVNDVTVNTSLQVDGYIGGHVVTLTDAVTIATDASDGNVFTVTLTDNRTLGAPTNLIAGTTYIWIIVQDVGGTNTLAYNSIFHFPGGVAPTLSTGGNAVDVITAVYDGTQLLCTFSANFATT